MWKSASGSNGIITFSRDWDTHRGVHCCDVPTSSRFMKCRCCATRVAPVCFYMWHCHIQHDSHAVSHYADILQSYGNMSWIMTCRPECNMTTEANYRYFSLGLYRLNTPEKLNLELTSEIISLFKCPLETYGLEWLWSPRSLCSAFDSEVLLSSLSILRAQKLTFILTTFSWRFLELENYFNCFETNVGILFVAFVRAWCKFFTSVIFMAVI